MQRLAVLAIVLAAIAPAHAETELHRQVQADLGLSVIHLAIEQPFTPHVAASLSAGVFGSYFLPWFDGGDDVIGVGPGMRVTWFQRTNGRGLYVAPYARTHWVSGDHDGEHGTGYGFTVGAFGGWVFGLGDKLDLRIGAGAQYIRHSLRTDTMTATTSTPFFALDVLVGYRL